MRHRAATPTGQLGRRDGDAAPPDSEGAPS